MEERNLQAIDGATLMGLHLEPTRFCVDTLLPQGVCFLGGASKIGKSWMVLDWCVRIAKGEPVWGLPTQKGTTLYLCLEDTLRRVQDRLNRITEEVPGNAYFSAQAETMAGGLLEEIRRFVREHPDTVLVAVDTFAVVRALGGDQTYGSDYQEVRQLKALADELKITLLNLLQNAATFQPTLYQKLQPLATWEEVQELAAQLEETQEQTVQKALSLVAQNNRQALSQIQEELEKERASRETFQQQVGKEQERFTSKLSEEFSAWKNELEDFQQQTERRWRQLRRRFTLGLLLSWALACGALWMLLR